MIWGDDLTDAQIKMVIASGEASHGSGYGVDLVGSGAWRVARALVKHGLGFIEGGAPNGSEFPGMYFNGIEGVRVVNEHTDDGLDADGEAFLAELHQVFSDVLRGA